MTECAVLYSQSSWDNLHREFDSLFNKKLTIKALNKAIEMNSSVLYTEGDTSLRYAITFRYIGSCYSQINKNDSALFNWEKSLNILNKQNRLNTFDGALCYQKIGTVYYDLGNLDDAIDNYHNAEFIYKKIYGVENEDYVNTISDLGAIFRAKGNYKEAERYLIRALTIKNKIYGPQNISCSYTLNNLSNLYSDIDKYNIALDYIKKAIEIIELNNGKKNDEYIAALNNLAGIYFDLADYQSAKNIYLNLLDLITSFKNQENEDYARVIGNIGIVNGYLGEYSSALLNLKKSLDVYATVLGEQHYLYAQNLREYAKVLEELGDYKNSKNSLQKAIDIFKKTLGEGHPEYADCLGVLGRVYMSINDYKSAETYFLNSSEIIKKAKGEENTDYASSILNLGRFYIELGNYVESEIYNKKALDIYEKTLGIKNIKYSTCLYNLGVIYYYRKDFKNAELYFKKSLFINKELLGKKNLNHANNLNSLGVFYNEIGDYKLAEKYFRKSVDITEKAFNDVHPDFASSLNNLAGLYREIGNYYKAEPLYLRALNIREKILGNNHPDYVNSLNDLALLYSFMSKVDKAANLYIRTVTILIKNWQSNLCFLSENEASLFLENNLYLLSGPLSFLKNYPNKELKAKLLDINLMLKNILLSHIQYLEEIASNNKDSLVINQWLQYKSIRLQLSNQLQLPYSKQTKVDQLKKEADVLEKYFMRNLPDFQNEFINNTFTWEDIKSKLKPTEVAIDFIKFRYIDKNSTESIHYAAFLIRPEWSEPEFINLFKEEQLIALFDSSNNSFMINKLYGDKSTLYHLIWKPLEGLLSGVKKVYISPSGLLHRISFSAISIPEGGSLNNLYEIFIMGNIRGITTKESKDDIFNKTSILFGGINYDSDLISSDKNDTTYSVISDSVLNALRGGKWSFLKGTSEEVFSIEKIAVANGINAKVFSGEIASEEAFKSIGKDKIPIPSILHIATHGFAISNVDYNAKVIDKFMILRLEEDKQNVFRRTSDPMTRTGLVMAGGNKTWSTGKSYTNMGDGILTAREISNMNLRGCNLVTLSACETGLGEIKDSEGVFGLQRAFKMAGVKFLIVSLWKIPDKETREFMNNFYTAWIEEKLPIKVAFRETQLKMSKKYSPYQWAAFVLLE